VGADTGNLEKEEKQFPSPVGEVKGKTKKAEKRGDLRRCMLEKWGNDGRVGGGGK